MHFYNLIKGIANEMNDNNLDYKVIIKHSENACINAYWTYNGQKNIRTPDEKYKLTQNSSCIWDIEITNKSGKVISTSDWAASNNGSTVISLAKTSDNKLKISCNNNKSGTAQITIYYSKDNYFKSTYTIIVPFLYVKCNNAEISPTTNFQLSKDYVNVPVTWNIYSNTNWSASSHNNNLITVTSDHTKNKIYIKTKSDAVINRFCNYHHYC